MQSARKKQELATPTPSNLAEWIHRDDACGNSNDATEGLLERISAQAELNAFITVSRDRARAQAERSDEYTRKAKRRALEGAPFAIKDNFCTEDIKTTAGSRILEDFVPNYESTVTERLLSAGAVFLGKTNMDEFGMGSSTENSAFGPTINPVGVRLGFDNIVPGGSSGGSAAAVAADLCLASVATDTGGSIRQPASFCGLVGFKPSYGTCSRWGVIAYASSLDQPGVLTKTTTDAALVLDVIAGHDPKDSTSNPLAPTAFSRSLGAVPSSPIIGIPKSFRDVGANDDLERLWDHIERALTEAGARVEFVDLPTVKYSLPAYYVIALCEASSNLARYDGVKYGHRADKISTLNEMYEMTRAEGFGEEIKRRIMLGTFALSAGYYDQYYLRAARVRAKIVREFAEAFKRVNWLVWPTAPTPAFRIGEHSKDPISMYLEDLYTVPVNLAGLPAVSVPGFTAASGLPMGFQIIGPAGGDTSVLAMAHRVESVLSARM
jgi:aspartyl-tRNA(Asn)/glutamyl-tRNA(Gln) amidotransferase subunit A